MPTGKSIGQYAGEFSSVRVCDISAGEQVMEGSYQAKVSGDLDGSAVGTMTFAGTNERGTMTDLGVGYLKSGDVTTYKANGVYWANGQGQWEVRAAVVMGDQTLVVEGQINLADDGVTLAGKILELT